MRIIVAAKVNAVSVLRRLEQRSLCYMVMLLYPVDCFEALNTVIEAQEQFDALPAKVRERFGNDPEAMLEFLNCEDKYFNNLQNPFKSDIPDSQILENEGPELGTK